MAYTYNLKFIGFFVFAFFLVGALTIPQSFAQDPDAVPDAGQRAQAFADDVIPSWIKKTMQVGGLKIKLMILHLLRALVF